MKLLSKIISCCLIACLLTGPLPLGAQGFAPSFSKKASRPDLLGHLKEQAFIRQPKQTVRALSARYTRSGKVDGRALAAILFDQKYIAALTQEEAATLVFLASVIREPDTVVERQLLRAALTPLKDYDEKDNMKLKGFYALVAAAFGHNAWTSRKVEDWAFAQVKEAAYAAGTGRHGVWASEVLGYLAVPSEENPWSALRRDQFEMRLEQTLRRFDWLKNRPADYKMRGVKNVFGDTNQGILISLFTQANSFFAMKDDDGFLKQMVSAGGLNPVGRALLNNGENISSRFSNDGESFYLHSPTPGTDGKGHFVASANGRNHFIVANLVQALFLSYHSQNTKTSSARMQAFIRSFLTTDKKGHFVHYLYVPLQGIWQGARLHDTSSLYGWEREEAALQKELYGKLKKGYPWTRACTGVQGACEVAVEWITLGKVFGWMFKGLGWGVSKGTSAVVKVLPGRALVNLAVLEIAGKQGLRWTQRGVKRLLSQYGWKAGVGAAAAAALRSDRRPNALAR